MLVGKHAEQAAMDSVVTPHLTCHIELELEGPTTKTLNTWCADALRKLADRIENDGFDDGHHAVKNNIGMQIGTIYVDYSGEF
jgi:hypothetical protein